MDRYRAPFKSRRVFIQVLQPLVIPSLIELSHPKKILGRFLGSILEKKKSLLFPLYSFQG